MPQTPHGLVCVHGSLPSRPVRRRRACSGRRAACWHACPGQAARRCRRWPPGGAARGTGPRPQTGAAGGPLRAECGPDRLLARGPWSGPWAGSAGPATVQPGARPGRSGWRPRPGRSPAVPGGPADQPVGDDALLLLGVALPAAVGQAVPQHPADVLVVIRADAQAADRRRRASRASSSARAFG
jgi:hypothetical protein